MSGKREFLEVFVDLVHHEMVVEAKYLGSLKARDDIRDVQINLSRSLGGAVLDRERKIQSTSKIRTFRKLKDNTRKQLMQLIVAHQSGGLKRTPFVKRVKALMRDAYYKSFSLGIQATGIGRLVNWPNPKAFQLSDADKRWVNSAIQQEGFYLKAFLKAVTAGTGRMPYHMRAKMYVETLDSMYESGRVVGTPDTSLAYWVTTRKPGRSPICPSCRQLAAWSPYLRKNVPTTPKAGMTICLTNCRCRLSLMTVTPDRLEQYRKKQRSMTYMINRLLQIKRTKGKGIKWLEKTS